MAAELTGREGGVPRGRRFRLRLPSAFIALSASALTAAALCAETPASGSVFGVLGVAVAGGLAVVASLALAEMRSTAPFSGGAWHFARMVHGVQGGFMLAWLEVCAMAATGGLFARTAWECGGRFADLLACTGGVTVARQGALLLGVGSPLAVACLVWMSLTPATPRPPSLPWRRALKWVSYGALALGWGIGCVFTGQFVAGARSFSAPPSIGWATLEWLRGAMVALACFCGVMHSVPGDAAEAELDDAGGGVATGEHRRYRLPRGILLGVLFCVLSAAWIALAGVSRPTPGAARGWLSAGWDAPWMLATTVAALGGLCFTVARSVRIMAAIAREGMLPPAMGRPHKDAVVQRRRQRRMGAGTGLLAVAVACWAPGWEEAACWAGVLHLLLAAATCFCLIRLRREVGDELDYGFVMPGFPWLPAAAGLALSFCGAFVLWWYPSSLVVVVVYATSGLLLHEYYARSHSLARSEDVALLDEDVPATAPEPTRETMRVLVAAADVTSAASLLAMARRLCGRRPTTMGLLHMVTVPENVRIAEAARNVSQAREIVSNVAAQLASESIALRTSVRYCRSVSRGILTTVRESRTDLLLLGWHGRLHRGQSTAWGRTLDPVLRRAPCNVVVAKGLTEDQRYRRVLVPLLEPFHSAFALNVASRLADDGEDATVTLFSAHGLGVDDVDVREFLRKNVRRVARASVRIACRTEVYGSVVEGILEEILRGGHDLVVLGATPPRQAALGEGSVATLIAARSHVPCVMVSAASRVVQWRNRWLGGD